MGSATELASYTIPLVPVYSCKYLGRILSSEDDNCPEVIHNLIQARQKWEWLTQVLGREREDARKLGMFYVAVVQVVLLYRSEKWVTSPRIGRNLGVFHHRVSFRLTDGN